MACRSCHEVVVPDHHVAIHIGHDSRCRALPFTEALLTMVVIIQKD